MDVLRRITAGVGGALRAVVGAIRFVNPLGGGPGVIADRRAMFGDDPENDPRRMDFDPNRPVHRRR